MLLGGLKPPTPMDQTVIATAPRQSAYFLGSGTAHFTVRVPSASAAPTKALVR